MRTSLLVSLAVLWATQAAHAQQLPVYGNGGVSYNGPYAYQAYQQPAQRSAYPYGYYGYGQAAVRPGAAVYYYPRSYYPNYYGYYYRNGGYGYYPQARMVSSGLPAVTTSSVAQPAAQTPPPPTSQGTEVTAVLPESSTAVGEYHPLVERPQPLVAESGVTFHRPRKEKFWVAGEYMLTWLRPGSLSGPLVTIGSDQDAHPGALGQPHTSVVFGNKLESKTYSGLALQGGLFLDCDNVFSVEAKGFYVFPNDQKFSLESDANGNPLIALPFFNTNVNEERGYRVSQPGLWFGGTAIDARSELGGFELNARVHGYWGPRCHADGLVGFRYVRLAERLKINDHYTALVDDTLTFQGAPINAGDQLALEDLFQTVNQFFGVQLGGRVSWEWNWFSVEGFAKLGLGATMQQVKINGTTSLITTNGTSVAQGGLFALPSNIGTYNHALFGVVPEVGFNVAVDATKHIRLMVGYSALFWDQVARPGKQIDHSLNSALSPSFPDFGIVTGPIRPLFRLNEEYFWAQSFNVGVEFHY